MKNVHVLQENIYITSNEEIKDGDWFLTDDKRVEKCAPDWRAREWHKKIILTTDPSLAPDVQKIDDEFLQWFVINPSCEFVRVDKNWNYPLDKRWQYKIIIPNQELKHETLEDAIERIKEEYPVWLDENAFELGAKWQQEQDKSKYSEKEVRGLLIKFHNQCPDRWEIDEWFNQNKNK